MSLTELTFLASLLAGVLCLVAGLLVTRVNWREDVPPFGRQSNVFEIAANPARYAGADALPVIRGLNAIGAILLAVAVLAVAWEAFSSAWAR